MTGPENSGKGGNMKNFNVLAFAALLPLAACGFAKPNQAPPFFCPQVAVLEQAQTLTLFLPNRVDVASRITTAQVTGVSGSCKLQEKKNAVLVTVKPAFLADNGPANNGAPLSLPWFTAITANDNIIQKSNYTLNLAFNGNQSTIGGTAKPIKIELPNTPDTANTEILVGFYMTPDQLAYAAAHPSAVP
jgi:hypothetical protein